jgi:hypothetical protein
MAGVKLRQHIPDVSHVVIDFDESNVVGGDWVVVVRDDKE